MNFQEWPGVSFFLPFLAISGLNLTFSKKIRWLDIDLNYSHAKFQPKRMKIEATRAKKRPAIVFFAVFTSKHL